MSSAYKKERVHVKRCKSMEKSLRMEIANTLEESKKKFDTLTNGFLIRL